MGEYSSKLLKGLGEDIDQKSKGYNKKPALSNLFILNNSHYIIKSAKGTKIVDKATLLEIEKTIKKQLDNYRDSWMPLLNHLVDQTKIGDNGRIVTTLSKQMRDAVKENFKVLFKKVTVEFQQRF